MTLPITAHVEFLMDYLLKYGMNVTGALLKLIRGCGAWGANAVNDQDVHCIDETDAITYGDNIDAVLALLHPMLPNESRILKGSTLRTCMAHNGSA
jgi:hypothetical protein